MRLLYLYPEEWTGRRAREVHTLSTCAALAHKGLEVTLVTAGGMAELQNHLQEICGEAKVASLHLVALSRAVGPIKSAAIFRHHFHRWRRTQPRFDWAYIIHLKAAAMLVHEHVMPYLYEAHEIFSQTPQKKEGRQIKLHELERQVLTGAAVRVTTSAALASALSTWFAMPGDFRVVPNAGREPLDSGVGNAEGPFVYCGSIADWKGLDLVIGGSRDAQVPLKIIGGTEKEWGVLSHRLDTSGVAWQPRVSLKHLGEALVGARAGVIPTQAEAASGHYSCPMKLFDYARVGLPVLSTALASLSSLDVGSWCRQIANPTRAAWARAMLDFRFVPEEGEAARTWAGQRTWEQRAEILRAILETADRR